MAFANYNLFKHRTNGEPIQIARQPQMTSEVSQVFFGTVFASRLGIFSADHYIRRLLGPSPWFLPGVNPYLLDILKLYKGKLTGNLARNHKHQIS